MTCKCPKCNAKIQYDARFCHNCGLQFKTAAPAPKKKSGCFDKLVKFVILPIAIVVWLSSMIEPPSTETPAPSATPVAKVTATAKPTATPTPKPTKTPKPTATPKPTKAVKTLEQVMEEIRVELSDYDFCEVFMDDEYIIVDIASEGMTTIAGFVIAEPTETSLQMWEQIKQSTIDLSKAINKSNKESGVHNRCVVRLISEVDNETILLSVSNDLVLFDVVNQ